MFYFSIKSKVYSEKASKAGVLNRISGCGIPKEDHHEKEIVYVAQIVTHLNGKRYSIRNYFGNPVDHFHFFFRLKMTL